jgi:hypothetical protein
VDGKSDKLILLDRAQVLTEDDKKKLQRLVPPPLELRGHQTIGRIHRILLAARVCGLEARPLQRQLQLSPGGPCLTRLGVERPDRRSDAE